MRWKFAKEPWRNISTRDVNNLELIIGFFKFFPVHNFREQSSVKSFCRSFSFCSKCWNMYMLPFDKILRCMKFICSDYCMWASGEVIEKRSTCFNLLEDNRTRCCLKRAMCWMVVYIRQKHIEPSTPMKSNKFVKNCAWNAFQNYIDISNDQFEMS